MKKTFVIALVLLLTCTFVFAQGADEDASAGKAPAKGGKVEWWDHFLPLAQLHRAIWDQSEKETGIPVEYTQYDPAKQTEALMLAFRTKSLPDVFSQVFSGVGIEATLKNEGWFSPMAVNKSELPRIVQDSLFEGYTLFDGKVYSFPTYSINHNAPLWYLTKYVSENEVPRTFEEARALGRKITQESNKKTYGFVVPYAFIGRMDATIEDTMNALGSDGYINWTTGEYNYASEEIFKVFEFFTGIWDDGTVLPASVNLVMRAARERWAAGDGAMLIDGSWNIGVVKSNFPTLYNNGSVGVTDPLREDGSKPYKVYKNPPTGVFYISSNSDNIDEATNALLKLMGDDYYIGLAEAQDQPPLDVSAVAKASVDPTYVEVCDMFGRTMAYKPSPVLRNVEVAKVSAEMKEIHPTPAEILQGYVSGSIKDWKSELIKYNNAMTKERERAITKCQKEGLNVSINDWIFTNYKYGESYLTNLYADSYRK